MATEPAVPLPLLIPFNPHLWHVYYYEVQYIPNREATDRHTLKADK
jgi:hypothetical protein